ncbi:MAG: thioredoxin domain-containing protein [Polyangiaceae bacterium]|nr:thioredoxin domain-containing protein [Polyangiaceae bacterium]
MSSLRAWWACLVLSTCAATACGGASEPAPRPPITEANVGAAPSASALVVADAATAPKNEGPNPVTADDPTRGSPNAPVTLVMFGDFECPFSAKAAKTLEGLEQRYGSERLRIVFKHNPLPFHKGAPMLHEASVSAFRAGGNEAFWAYFDSMFLDGGLTDPAELRQERAIGAASQASPELEKRWSTPTSAAAAEKVASDMANGKTVGVRGTPTFFINGRFLSGSQEASKFEAIIDNELATAERSRAGKDWYALRTAENLRNAPPPPTPTKPPEPPPPDLVVYNVPLGKSPSRGPANALVTIVMFGDFECLYSQRSIATLDALRKRYASDVRIVFKHHPLPFHKKAGPAHQLAQEIFVKKGNDAFWKAHDTLFENRATLDEATLTRVATEAGLAAPAALAAVKAEKHKRVIEDDVSLADGLDAGSTPQFFINGRRLIGSQPIEKFAELIDQRLAEARAIEKNGTPTGQVYAEIMKTAKTPELERTQPPAIPAGAPSRGPKNAPVTIQVFASHECRFCKTLVTELLPEMEKQFPGKLRIVWRNLPLPHQKSAPRAAVAALEVRKAKGDAAFWKMTEALLAATDLGTDTLASAAAKLGLPAETFAATVEASTFHKVVEADMATAKSLRLGSTPTMFVNDLLVVGAKAPPLRRAIRQALSAAPRK